MLVANCSVTGTLHDGRWKTVYAAVDAATSERVVLKCLKGAHPPVSEIERLRREFHYTRARNHAGITRSLRLEAQGNGLVLVQENAGDSLRHLLSSRAIGVADALGIARSLAEVLSAIHRDGLVHRDVNPNNIIVRRAPPGLEVRLTDFGLAIPVPPGGLQVGEVLEGTFAYMAPEQTGRPAHRIDHRSDLYALGVTLHEMLAGATPFAGSDPLELIHSHLTRTPVPVHEVNPLVPAGISSIVLKLLAKNPDDRYQSGAGLGADLAEWLDRLGTDRVRAPFQPGAADVPARLLLPSALYGRESETAQLAQSLRSAADGASELIILTGEAGVGKTSLVLQGIGDARGGALFAWGKYEAGSGAPLGAIVQALRLAVRRILTLGAGGIAEWRTRLTNALGATVRIAVDLVPEMAHLAVDPPPLSELSTRLAENRLFGSLAALLQSLATPGHPFVLFLDDLQWADPASLALLARLFDGGGLRGTLIVLASRLPGIAPGQDGERLVRTIANTARRVELGPLGAEDLRRLVADALAASVQDAAPLADRILESTAGNPFWARTMLRSLHEQGTIVPRGRGWSWDQARVERSGPTENVARAIAQRIAALSADARRILEVAWGVGGDVLRQDLALVTDLDEETIEAALGEAAARGILSVETSAAPGPGLVDGRVAGVTAVHFAHDRIRDAVAETITPEREREIRLALGRHLRDRLQQPQRGERLLEIAGHLNRAMDLIVDPGERVALAAIDLEAASRARRAAAYPTALACAEAGIALLGETRWETSRVLALGLCDEAAEAAYLCTDFVRCESLVAEIQAHTSSVLEGVQAHDVLLHCYMAQQRLPEAVALGLRILGTLGIHVPRKPGMLHMLWHLARAKLAIGGRTPEELARLDEMRDPVELAATRLAATVGSICFFTTPEVLPVIGLQAVRLAARRGNSPFAAFSYGFYAVILGILGDVEGCHAFGRFAMDLVDRFKVEELRAKIPTMFFALIDHRKNSLQGTIAPLLGAYRSGLEIGDIEFAALAQLNYVAHLWFAGRGLQEIHDACATYLPAVERLKQERHGVDMRVVWQLVQNLMGLAADPLHLEGAAFSETASIPGLVAVENRETLNMVYAFDGVLRYLLGDIEGALEHAGDVEAFLKRSGEVGTFPMEHFYLALTFLAAAEKRAGPSRKRLLRRAKRHQGILRKWADHAPVNHLHKWTLVEAERLRLRGRDAVRLYDDAIAGARDNGYVQDFALASELCGRHFLAKRQERIASLYMRDALHGYARWGAKVKVRDLERRYAAVLGEEGAVGPSQPQRRDADLGGIAGTTLKVADLHLVLDAYRVISGELVLEELLRKTTRILMQSAGAETGALVLQERDRLDVETCGRAVDNGLEITVARQSLGEADLPESVVLYAARTGTPLVLADASANELFRDDPCVVQRHIRSVACTPIVHQGKQTGLIYLENNHMAGAFRDDRLVVISIIASQAAISLETATLYARLTADVEARKRVERDLRESEQTARGLLNALTDPALLVDSAGTLLDSNNAFAARFGDGKPDARRGGSAWDLVGGHRVVLQRLLDEALRTGEPARGEHSGDAVVWEIAVYPLVPRGDVPRRATVVMFDVTERRRAREQEELHSRQLVEADKLATIGVLVASVAHEVSSPNHAIRLGAQVLAAAVPDMLSAVEELADPGANTLLGGLPLDELRQRVDQALGAVQDGSRRIGVIIRDLVDYAAQEQDDPAQLADANEVVRSAVRLLDSYLRQSAGSLTMDLCETLPSVRISYQRLEQVVINLLQNACQATPSADLPIVISTALDPATRQVLISVTDRGAGIPAEILSRLTEPFFTTHRAAGGTGLGLSISSRILAKHGGCLRFESELGRGTVATIILPAPT
jgi:predicted ATPase/signal transduction histidine kinase